MTNLLAIACPNCGKKSTWTPENTYKPFCSERCKLIDLGAWADETHRIPGEAINPEPGENNGREEGDENNEH